MKLAGELSVLPFGDYIVYVDESGDHSLVEIDPEYSVFVLFCIFAKEDFILRIVPAVQKLKFDWFGHDMVVLHEREIRQQKPPFKFLQTLPLRTRFMRDLSALVENAPFTIIAAVIDKIAHRKRYAEPDNPYSIALRFCLERLLRFLNERDQAGRLTHCVFEKRGAAEDRDLELVFRRVCAGENFGGTRSNAIDIVFADKKTNSAGLQFADLTARPIGLHVLRPDQPNRAFDIIRHKFRSDSNGVVLGRGLKIFP